MWGWILQAVHTIGDALAAAGAALLTALKWFAVHAWYALRWLGEGVAKGFAAAWRGIQKFWTEILPKFAANVACLAKRFDTFLHVHFGGLIDAIKKIVKGVNWVYKNVLQPLFQIIDVFRAVFRVLGDLGVGWAKKVDEWLGNLEAKIWNAFENVRGWLNHTLGLFAWLLDPFGQIRRGHFLGAFGRDMQHLIAVTVRTQRSGHLGTRTDLTTGDNTDVKQRVEQFKTGEIFEDPAVTAAVDSFDDVIGQFFA